MKFKLLFLVCNLSIAFCAYSQNESILKQSDEILQIKNAVKNMKKLERIKDPNGINQIFLAKNEVRIIIASRLRSEGEKENIALYYQNGNLIYTENNWTNAGTSYQVHVERHYFDNGQLIGWVNDKNEIVTVSTKELQNYAGELAKYGKNLFAAAMR